MGKGPHHPGETSNCSFGGSRLESQGAADTIIRGCATMQLWFSFTFYIVVFHLVSHEIFQTPGSWAELQGLKKVQAPCPFLSKVPLDLLVTICVFASRHIVQARSEVSERPSLQPLKPEQAFLRCNFPNTAPTPLLSNPAQRHSTHTPAPHSQASAWPGVSICRGKMDGSPLCPS